MSKIELNTVLGTYDVTQINNNFRAIQEELDEKVLYRDNPEGEPNIMASNLDMNNKRILNLPAPVSPNEAARLQDVLGAAYEPPIAATVPFSPVGTISATNVQAAIQELMNEMPSGGGSNVAADITVVPFSTIASTNVQAALQEIVSEMPVVPTGASVAPLQEGVAAIGVSARFAREDHVHPAGVTPSAAAIPFTPVSTIAATNVQAAIAEVVAELPVASSTLPIVEGTAAIGVSTAYARADHVHPSGGGGGSSVASGITVTPFSTIAATNVQAALEEIVSEQPQPASSAPLAPNSSAVLGSSALYARQDHRHISDAPVPASSAPLAPNTSAVVGTSLLYARQDHRHISDAPGPATVAPLSNGTAAVGTSLLYARQDHVHPVGSGGGALVQLASSAITEGSSTVSFLNIFSDTYKNYVIFYRGASGTAHNACLQLASAGVAVGSLNYSQIGMTGGPAGLQSFVQLNTSLADSSATGGVSSVVTILGARDTNSGIRPIICNTLVLSGSGYLANSGISNCQAAVGAMSGFQIFLNGGASFGAGGHIEVYGYVS